MDWRSLRAGLNVYSRRKSVFSCLKQECGQRASQCSDEDATDESVSNQPSGR